MIDAQAFLTRDYIMVRFSDLGIEAPATWADEFTILDSTTNFVYRYQPRLGAGGMAGDLVIDEWPNPYIPWASNIYEFSLGDCGRDEPMSYGCAEAPARAGRAGLAGGLAAAALLLIVAIGMARLGLRRG